MSWISTTPGGTAINIRISPRSSRDEICGLHGEELKIKIKAPPVDGKANKTLIRFLAKTLSITQKDITIISGETSRSKRIMLHGVKESEALEMLV